MVDIQELRLILHGQVLWSGRLQGPTSEVFHLLGAWGMEGLATVMADSFDRVYVMYSYYEASMMRTRKHI